MRRAAALALFVVTAAGVLTLFVLPGRTLWQQRASVATTRSQIVLLDRENSALAAQIRQLHDPAYIEHIARLQYGLTMPDEKAYAIVPPAATTTTVPSRTATRSRGAATTTPTTVRP